MLNIVLLYYEPQPSGQTAHVTTLARGLDPRRYHLTVVLPQSLARSVTAFEDLGAAVVPLPLGKTLWKPQAIVDLVRLLRRQGPDVVHIHSQEAGLLGRVLARLAGARLVLYTPQTIDIRRARWHWLYVWLERTLAHITDTIISVNETDRARLIRWGIPPHKTVTVPNGIELAEFQGAIDVGGLRRAVGLEEGRPVVMQVGRLSAQKDPLAFVQGAALVIEERPDAQFALVGDGPLRDKAAARIRELRLEGTVRLTGWHDQAFRMMAAADVVTLTSRWEGAPYSLLEAMAWSRPVAAMAVNGCPEIVEDGVTGFLVPPGDIAAWARCVIDLLNDPSKAAAMGQQGRRRVEERFTLAKMIARLETLYERASVPH